MTALKSFFGNLGAGSGAVELLASVISLDKRLVPITLNYTQPDPDCPVNVVRDEALTTDKPAALALSQSRTGQATALVIARP